MAALAAERQQMEAESTQRALQLQRDSEALQKERQQLASAAEGERKRLQHQLEVNKAEMAAAEVLGQLCVCYRLKFLLLVPCYCFSYSPTIHVPRCRICGCFVVYVAMLRVPPVAYSSPQLYVLAGSSAG